MTASPHLGEPIHSGYVLTSLEPERWTWAHPKVCRRMEDRVGSTAAPTTPTLADLAADPAPTAEVDLDHLPELLGEMERLRAMGGLALRINRPAPTKDWPLLTAGAALPTAAGSSPGAHRTRKANLSEVLQ